MHEDSNGRGTNYMSLLHPKVLCHVQISPAENMTVIIHHAKDTNRNCEIGCQQFQPGFNPLFAMLNAFPTQKRPPHTSRNALAITRQAGIY